MRALQAAIPGQSLTDEPRNFPWDRPPEIVAPDEEIRYHIDRVSKEDVIDNIFFALEFGVPVKNLTDSLMTGAVAKGIHSIDVSIIAAPIVRKFISKAADTAGIEYKEEFEVDDKTSPMDRAAILVSAAMATPKEEQDEGFELIKEAGEAAQQQAEPQEEAVEETKDMAPPKQGLMARV